MKSLVEMALLKYYELKEKLPKPDGLGSMHSSLKNLSANLSIYIRYGFLVTTMPLIIKFSLPITCTNNIGCNICCMFYTDTTKTAVRLVDPDYWYMHLYLILP